MGVQLDIILPPIIVGILIILIFRINAFMMESSADARLINDVQNKADTAINIIQEELRGLNSEGISISTDTLQFSRDAELNGNLVSQDFMFVRDDSNGQLKIFFNDLATGEPDSLVYGLNLRSIDFFALSPQLLRVRVESESNPEHHVRFRNDQQTVRAVSERDFLLRHRSLATQQE